MNVNPFQYAYFANPYEKPYNEDGSYRADMTYFLLGSLSDGVGANIPIVPANGFNILREMRETSGDADQSNVVVRVNLKYQFTDKIRFDGLASYTYTNNRMVDIKKQDSYAAFEDHLYFDDNNRELIPYGNIERSESNADSYSARGFFTYDDIFGSHRLSLLAGAELRGDKTVATSQKRYGYDHVTGNSSILFHLIHR